MKNMIFSSYLAGTYHRPVCKRLEQRR